MVKMRVKKLSFFDKFLGKTKGRQSLDKHRQTFEKLSIFDKFFDKKIKKI